MSGKSGSGSQPPIIRKLDETVVNRIAAGEVIQRPANALKEMMENSLDAGSTSITVQVKSGGLKMLQIGDNGCGIRKDDMSIVCERFTTSKLDKFEDLQSIGTFGFRGEALASISHVAHLTIVTRTKDSKCAWKASYSDGVLKGDPRPTAGNQGTVITVEDLFYNVSTRKKALNNPAEEHAKIADVVTKYAIHNSGKGFTLKKAGESNTDVKTAIGSSIRDNIRNIYGAALGKELIEVAYKDDQYQFQISGFISGPNYEAKRMILLLFINNRLVDCPSVRKALTNIYGPLLAKGGHPFAYLSLVVPSQTIDVNVHPTKHEVHFLHEDAIVDIIEKQLESQLLERGESRKYAIQTLLPASMSQQPTGNSSTKENNNNEKDGAKKTPNVYAHQMVRTDCKSQKLDAFFEVSSRGSASGVEANNNDKAGAGTSDTLGETRPFRVSASTSSMNSEIVKRRPSESLTEDDDVKKARPSIDNETDFSEEANSRNKENSSAAEPIRQSEAPSASRGENRQEKDNDDDDDNNDGDPLTMGFNEPLRRPMLLRSVRELREEIKASLSSDLKTLFRDSVFVGCVSRRHLLLQHSTCLYLVNVEKASTELFYQIMIADFGNFGLMRLSTPAPIFELTKMALDLPESGWTPADGPKEEMAEFCRNLLVSKREMLEEYFSMEIDEEGNVRSLPLLLNEYLTCLDHLPLCLIKLAGEVDWEEEKPCFETFCRTMASFYAVKEPFEEEEDDDNNDDNNDEGNDGLAMGDGKTGANEDEDKKDGSDGLINKEFSVEGDQTVTTKDAKEVNLDGVEKSVVRILPSAPGSWPWVMENVVYRALKSKSFVPTQKLASDGSVLRVANLTDLYKVFERC